ncbi:MAG: KamA family radical SAM protein [Halothiobacillaceae bacterium]
MKKIEARILAEMPQNAQCDPADKAPHDDLRVLVGQRVDAGADRSFPFRVTAHVLGQVRDWQGGDPVLGQFLPVAEENRKVPGFGTDPVGDLAARKQPALLQKYAGRALLMVTGRCAVHCRYCFRRHFPYDAGLLDEPGIEQALAPVQGDPSITEVILSGGDPLILSSRRWVQLVRRIEAIGHVRRLRIHSRVPTVLPDHLDDGHFAALAESRLRVVLVAHVNHPDELDDKSRAVFEAFSRAGVTCLNQSVLLAGVNDRVDVLARLSEALFDQGVLPYYLHQLDQVAGAAHFEVPVAVGCQLVKALRARLPGYLVPRYVFEEAGAPAKTPIDCSG